MALTWSWQRKIREATRRARGPGRPSPTSGGPTNPPSKGSEARVKEEILGTCAWKRPVRDQERYLLPSQSVQALIRANTLALGKSVDQG